MISYLYLKRVLIKKKAYPSLLIKDHFVMRLVVFQIILMVSYKMKIIVILITIIIIVIKLILVEILLDNNKTLSNNPNKALNFNKKNLKLFKIQLTIITK